MEFLSGGAILFIMIIGSFLAMAVRILNEYERGVIFRLGRIQGAKGPGLILLIPVVDKMVRVDLRTVTLDVPAQDAITRDNVTVKVNAVVYFRVLDPNRAVVEVENYLLATSKLAQTTLRSVMGQVELDELLSAREAINHKLQTILDTQTEPWGVKVSNVEVKQIDLPAEMQRAMARQAEAERERRAKIIAADGEYQASKKLSEAAEVMNQNPITIQLRYLQTMVEISSERNTTTFMPIPLELMKGMFSGGGR
ncbi:MAG: slipin family protein [Bdellovibrionota bacterium]